MRKWLSMMMFSGMLSLNTSLGVRCGSEAQKEIDKVSRFRASFDKRKPKHGNGPFGKRYF